MFHLQLPHTQITLHIRLFPNAVLEYSGVFHVNCHHKKGLYLKPSVLEFGRAGFSPHNGHNCRTNHEEQRCHCSIGIEQQFVKWDNGLIRQNSDKNTPTTQLSIRNFFFICKQRTYLFPPFLTNFSFLTNSFLLIPPSQEPNTAVCFLLYTISKSPCCQRLIPKFHNQTKQH